MAGLSNIDVSVNSPDINSYFIKLDSYAKSAITSAGTIASSLNNFYPVQYSPVVSFDSTSTNTTLGALTRPTVPTLSLGSRVLPASPSIVSPTVALVAAPLFTEISPDINLPAVPSPLTALTPVKDFIVNTSFDYPVTPDTTLPIVPTLRSLNLPTLDIINLPTFDLAFPTSNALVVPGITFSYSDGPFSSTLLDGVKNELLSRLSKSTGLNPTVEQALWDRGRDRESRAALLAQRSLLVDQASSGFTRPTGAINASLDSIIQDTQSKLIELSREIMIKQADLEQENIKFSIQQSIALEDILIREHNNIAQRSFEVAKYIQDIQVELFKASVAKYTSEVEAYKAFSNAYQSRVQAELTKVEIFKAKIEGEKLKGDLNEQDIRVYLAQLEGIKSNVEIYKSLVATISEKLKAEGLKLDVFKTDIEAYSEFVKAKASEYSIYSEQIKGELAKVEIFDSKVKAFTSRIQAYAAQSDTVLKKAEVESSIQGLNIKKYEADIQSFIEQVRADQLIYTSAVELYRGQSQIYLADAGVNRAVAELELKNSENIITQNKYKADVSLQNAQITLESLKSAYGATLEGKKAAGSIYSQIGASSLSALNVSASVQGQVSIGASESHNYTDQ
jgi:hypothetical protein